MFELFVIFLLGIGHLPVIVSPINAQVRVETSDSPLIIKAVMHAKSLRAKDISRPMGISESYVGRTINKKQTKRLTEVINFINDYKSTANNE